MIAQDQEGEKGGDRNVSLLNKSQPEKAGRLSAELWMGDFPSETAGNRESSGIPSSHRKRCLTSLSTHPMEGCAHDTCAHWCLSCAVSTVTPGRKVL